MSFFEELKRRNVIRVGIAYAVGAWLLAQAADLVLDVMGAPDIILRSLVAILALGFIPAVIFAWAFEMTPEGIKKEKEVDRTRSITHHTAKKLDIATMILLVAAIGLLALDRFVPKMGPDTISLDTSMEAIDDSSKIVSGPISDQKSLAVLPFVDMSPAKDNEYFTDGLTEELLNILAQIKSLQVAGRTSSFAFKGKTEDLREIGEKLNVNTLLEGSVRKDDKSQKIRVTVQLINVEDGYHIWSDTYDRDLEDIFAIQEDIATQVADALKINLLGEEATPVQEHARTGMNAYDLYLQGLQNLRKFTYDSLPKSKLQFEAALQLDPEYQPAREALVLSLLEMVETGAMPLPEAVALANPLLDELLSSDPENDNALTYRGRVYDFERNYAAADEYFNKALQLNSRNAYTLTTYGKFMFDRGHVDEGLGYLQQAQQIEPYDIKLQWNLCASLGRLVDETGAVRECGRIGDIEPGNPMQFYGMQYLHDYRGEKTASLLWRTKSMEADPDDVEIAGGFVFDWLDMGDLKLAEQWAAKTAGMNPDHPAAVVTRVALLQAQELYQEALEVANKAYADKLPDRHGSNQFIYQVIVNDAVNKRDFNHALEVLMALLPKGLDSPLESQDVKDAILMSSLAQVIKLQEPGSEQITALLDHAEQLNQESDDRVVPFLKPFRQASIEVVRGNKELAISKLEESINKGWRFGWREVMQTDFQFEPLRREPKFQELVAFLEADMEKQRAEAYEALGITP